jgi:hypothetical protein
MRGIVQAISAIARKDVLVGIPDTAPDRKDGPLTNAAIGYIHDQGSPAQGIPARPWLRPGISDAQDKIARQLGNAAEAAIEGDASSAETSLESAGLVAQNAVRNKINTGDFTPLAASTIRARKRRGRSGTRPLIDTGSLRNSITYVVRDK